MDVTIERHGYAYGNTIRTLFYCARERAYYVLSTDSRGDSLVFPARSSGVIIEFSEVYAKRRVPEYGNDVNHALAVEGFEKEDPTKVRARLEDG